MKDMKVILTPGMSKQASFMVEKWHLASEIGSGDTRVFSTPMLVAGIEMAAAAVARPCLEPGLTTVGVHMDVYHKVASPPGMMVTFEATLVEISPNGKGLHYKVRAWDESGEISVGQHERVIVNQENFEAKAEERGRQAAKKESKS